MPVPTDICRAPWSKVPGRFAAESAGNEGRAMDDSKVVNIGSDDRLWPVNQAADLLSVTTKTLYRHMRDGTVGSVRVGPRLLRIPHTELVAFLQIRSKKKAG